MNQVEKYLRKLTVNLKYLQNIYIRTGVASIVKGFPFQQHKSKVLMPAPFKVDPETLSKNYDEILKQYLFIFIHNAWVAEDHPYEVKLHRSIVALNDKLKESMQFEWVRICYEMGASDSHFDDEEILEQQAQLSQLGNQHLMISELMDLYYKSVIAWFMENKITVLQWYKSTMLAESK